MNWEPAFYISGTIFFTVLALALVAWVVVIVIALRRVNELKMTLTEKLNRPSGLKIWPLVSLVVPLIWRLAISRRNRA